MNFEWTFSAAHIGDCFLYVSYDINTADADKEWFKISNFMADENPPRDCRQGAGQQQGITLPSWLPTGDAIFRWEWYALHVRSGGRIEYYSQCIDVTVTGGSSVALADINPKFKIGTHLPSSASLYRDGFSPNCDQDLRTCTRGDGVPLGNNFLVGPELATVSSSVLTPTPSSNPNPSPTPQTTIVVCSFTYLNPTCQSTYSSSDCASYTLPSCAQLNTSIIGWPSDWREVGADINPNPPFESFDKCTTVSSLSYRWTCGSSAPGGGADGDQDEEEGRFGHGFAAGFFVSAAVIGLAAFGGVWLCRRRKVQGNPVAVPAWTGMEGPDLVKQQSYFRPARPARV